MWKIKCKSESQRLKRCKNKKFKTKSNTNKNKMKEKMTAFKGMIAVTSHVWHRVLSELTLELLLRYNHVPCLLFDLVRI